MRKIPCVSTIILILLSLFLLQGCDVDQNESAEEPTKTISENITEDIGSEKKEDITDATETFFEDTDETEFLTNVTETETTEPVTEEITTEAETECPHDYDYDCSDTCNLCNEERSEIGEHAYTIIYTCHDMTCANCGFVLEQAHDYVVLSDSRTLLTEGECIEKCSKCNDIVTTSGLFEPSTLDIPVIYITEKADATVALNKLSKSHGEITVGIKYVSNTDTIDDFECSSTIKVQGASSAGHPKKNYNIKLYTDDTLEKKKKVDLGWGKENKYCLKANYVDASQSRNIVGARIFAQMAQTRENLHNSLLFAPNYGVIDGYPVLVYINGEFHGLYTLNIPKDEWMFGMNGGEESCEALLMADAWTDCVRLKKKMGDGEFSEYGYELEYCSTTDDSWVKDSFNDLILLLNCGDNWRIKAELADHLDIDAAIDNMIFTYFINAADNIAKNILWATYDGKVWIPSVYDMDGTFGMWWNGQPLDVATESATPSNTCPTIGSNNKLKIPGSMMYTILIELFPERVQERYKTLRKTIFTYNNINETFNSFLETIPEIAYISDLEKWQKIPYPSQNRNNMLPATKEQLARLDTFFYNFY